MILDMSSYNEDISKVINTQDFQSPMDYFFFLLALLEQQKLINKVNEDNKSKAITL
jgi:hypothetical protein